jgi:hypothetical protein
MLRILEHGSYARLLTAGKTAGGECPPGAASTPLAASILRVNDPFRQSFVHGNVIQVTKRVLQAQPRNPSVAARPSCRGTRQQKIPRHSGAF